MKVSCEPKSIRLISSQDSSKLATASITLDNEFVVRNLSVMNGSKGVFVSMPSQRGVDKDGKTQYYDTAFPLSKELRSDISKAVLDAYTEKLNELQQGARNRDNSTPSQSPENNSEDDEYSNEMF